MIRRLPKIPTYIYYILETGNGSRSIIRRACVTIPASSAGAPRPLPRNLPVFYFILGCFVSPHPSPWAPLSSFAGTCGRSTMARNCGKGLIASTLLLLLVCYSSMNWIGSLSTPSARKKHSPHNATLSGADIVYDNGSSSTNIESNISTAETKNTAGALMQPSYIQLPPPNSTSQPISFSACCGIGHRLARNIPVMAYAIGQSRPLHAYWTDDVMWSTLFNDTDNIKEGPKADAHYANDFPDDWLNSSLASYEPVGPQVYATAYQRYGETGHALMEMPLAQSIVKSLSDNLSSLVLSFLQPMREQYATSDMHLCVHIREGNNETGDWEKKQWRHIDLLPTLEVTLESMRNFTRQNDAKKISIFVASDTKKARLWFEENSPDGWQIIKPAKELPRPENGVWFGELLSTTNAVLSKDDLNEVMAEAVADVFALGECDALYVPNYSSFSIPGIMLTRAERKKVFFYWFNTFVEYPQPLTTS